MVGHLLPPLTPNAIRFFFAGNLWVSLFFFYTGYGLQLSFKKNENYFDGFLSKKLISVYIPFVFAEAFSCAVKVLTGDPMTAGEIFLALLGVKLSNPVLWYIDELLAVYLVFYLVKRGVARNGLKSVWERIAYAALYCLFLIAAVVLDVGTWWYISTFCLLMGLNTDLLFRYLFRFQNAGKWICSAFCLLYGMDRLIAFAGPDAFLGLPITYLITAFALVLAPMFVLTCAFISEMVVMKNRKLLALFGTISYEIYLYHMVFGLLFQKMQVDPCWRLFLSVVCTLGFSWVMHQGYRRLRQR